MTTPTPDLTPEALAAWEPQLVEQLAALSHEQWAGWTEWMMHKWDAAHVSGEPYRARWARQVATPYDRLSEDEKESDRIEARKVLDVIREAIDAATRIERRLNEQHQEALDAAEDHAARLEAALRYTLEALDAEFDHVKRTGGYTQVVCKVHEGSAVVEKLRAALAAGGAQEETI